MHPLNQILKQELELIEIPKSQSKEIKTLAKEFCNQLSTKLKSKKINAEVFIGGSLAKSTMVKKKIQDVDIFIRFNREYNNKKLPTILNSLLPKKAKKVHGSRDYFQITQDNLILEIIPVMKIRKPTEAINITDLSYFHVNYLLKKIRTNKNLTNEIMLAKTFAHACDCYGAESYINGFSGYALELLICHYKTFSKFLKEIIKIDNNQIIIDDAKFYKTKKIALESLNKSKLQSPIILIDPTFKERNALAGLSKETFIKFQKYSEQFLNKPSHEFFKTHNISEEFLTIPETQIIEVTTSKQAGDIAGTKSKKFFKYFSKEISKEFNINKTGFNYDDEINLAKFYFVIENKKDEIIKGPPINNKESIKKFKKVHKDSFTQKGFACIKIKHTSTFKEWFKTFTTKNKKIIQSMSITKLNHI